MSTKPQTFTGNNLPVWLVTPNLDRTATVYHGQGNPATIKLVSPTEIQWNGVKSTIGFKFLNEVVGIDRADLQAAIKAKPRLGWTDILFAEVNEANNIYRMEYGADDEPTADVPETAAPDANAALMAELAAMKAENQRLRDEKARGATVTMKVSEKGALSIYGMGRFPVTLYREQWEKLLAMTPDIKAFMQANASKLSAKPTKPAIK